MISDELKKYVLDNVKIGWEKENIEKVLLEAGWSRDEIGKVFKDDEVKALFSKQNEVTSDSEEESEKEDKRDDDQNKEIPDPVGSGTSSPNAFTISYKDETPDPFETGRPPAPEDSSPLGNSMLNADLSSYVKNSLDEGFSKSVVKKVALQAGWSDAEIDGVLKEGSDS